ncbi:hypothetical protein [Paenibacillus senegalimassiliensis]|uniref:hypothetical protein n=1 Tax=Paenibacillus senegalimassiliensis TaxID=1737426 RepID=UPI00073F9060|nr:hypothetical protein [Paenibacillus senegalimassiliensis]
MKKLVVSLTVCALLGTASVAAAAPIGKTAKATIQYFNFIVGGQNRATADALVFNSTTYVPIREAANLFNYSTFYDPALKSISFESKNEWVTLSELVAANSELSASAQSSNPLTYEVKKAGEVIFRIDSSSISDGLSATIVDNQSREFTVKKELGSLVISKDDVLAAGYKAY